MENKSLYIFLYHLLNIRKTKNDTIKNKIIYRRSLRLCKNLMMRFICDHDSYDSSSIFDYCSFIKSACMNKIIDEEIIRSIDDKISIRSVYNIYGESYIKISLDDNEYTYAVEVSKDNHFLNDIITLRYAKSNSDMDNGIRRDNRTSYSYEYNKFYRMNDYKLNAENRKDALGNFSYELLKEVFIMGIESVISGLKKELKS